MKRQELRLVLITHFHGNVPEKLWIIIGNTSLEMFKVQIK